MGHSSCLRISVLCAFIVLGGVAVAAPAGTVAGTAANAKLRDTRWSLKSIDGIPAGEFAEGKASAPYIVLSSASQHLGGFGGCNQLRGRFTQRGTQLAVSAISATRRGCAAALMAQEQKLISALGSVDAYRIEGSRLSLLQGENVQVVFESAAGRGPKRKKS